MNSHDFERWFDILWPRIRDVLAFGIGIFLLTKPSVSATQAAIGTALCGVTVAGVTQWTVKRHNNKNNNRKNE